VANLLRTTAAAGSAQFSYTHVTTSTNQELRGSLSGHGAVDFTSGSVEVTEVDHQVDYERTGNGPVRVVPTTTTNEDVAIGKVQYQRIGDIGPLGEWRTLSFPRASSADLGLQSASNAAVALDLLEGPEPIAAVRELGPATVGGVATTRYLVEYAPLHTCGTASPTTVLREGPSTIWVDGAGRLVQISDTERFDWRVPASLKSKFPSFTQLPTGVTTTTDTLRFSDFGGAVHITAPPVSAVLVGGDSFSVGSASIATNHRCGS
jgi:hypothetical protein